MRSTKPRPRGYKDSRRIADLEAEQLRYERAIRPRRTTQLKVSRLPLGHRRPNKRDYAAYLRSDHWQSFRERYRAEGLLQECFVCGASEVELHHLTYARLWAEKIKDVMPLCGVCHIRVHNVVKRAKLTLARAPIYLKARTAKERESYD